MGTILHIYKVDEDTTDEFVNENFTQKFVHLHLEDGTTVLFRSMHFSGKRLDTIKDEDEIIRIMKEVEKTIPEEDRHKIGEFLSGGKK